MKFESYKAIKNKIANYVMRVNKLKYKGYEEDLAYLKGLCTEFQRTVGDEAERKILNHLDDFERNLINQEFYAKIKTQKVFIDIMSLRKKTINSNEDIKKAVNDLLTDYVNLMWKYYGKKTDADLILGMIVINKRLNNLNNIIELSHGTMKLTK